MPLLCAGVLRIKVFIVKHFDILIFLSFFDGGTRFGISLTVEHVFKISATCAIPLTLHCVSQF